MVARAQTSAAARRPTRAELLAAAGRTVPDVIAPRLKVLFCGINPGLYSAWAGHHFARPGNRFWPALFASGFTRRLLRPDEEHELVKIGFGVTNLVDRATLGSGDLNNDELHTGGVAFVAKVKRYRPRAVAILGVSAYRLACQRSEAEVGEQSERIGGALVWVLQPQRPQCAFHPEGARPGVPEIQIGRRGGSRKMKMVLLPAGQQVSAFGMGTWHMGDNAAARPEEVATLRLGLDRGATLIDTAEMYGDGRAEEVVGEATEGRREEVFVVSKVLPSNASHRGTVAACERSLRRLRTDRIDLYLLHWRGNVPFQDTIAAFTELQRTGKIRYYGVSNLDLNEVKEWWSVAAGQRIQTNQLLYNLTRRGIEWDLLPWLREHRLPVMAYSPIEQARVLNDSKLIRFAREHNITPPQAALGWLLAQDNVIVIPKTRRRERLLQNLGALEHPLTRAQLTELEQLFPPPTGPQPLEIL